MRTWWILSCGLTALVAGPVGLADERAQEGLTPEQRGELEAEADHLFEEGVKHFQAGKPIEALELQQRELELRRRLHGTDDHATVARGLNAIGFLHVSLGRAGEAVPFFRDSLAMTQRLHMGRDHPDLMQGLNNMGSLLSSLGRFAEALPFSRDALEMTKRLHKNQDHADLALSLNNVGTLLLEMGRLEEALPYYRDALAMRRRLHQGRDQPEVALTLNNMGGLLESLGQSENALSCYEEALAMRRRLYPDQDHPDLAASLNSMGSFLQGKVQYETALPFYQDALAMYQRLHKGRDHPDPARSLNNMGNLLESMGQSEKALPYFRDALAMRQRLSAGRDHPAVAISLNNMGSLLQAMGQPEAALPYYRDALAMRQRLSAGRDHPSVATSLNNMGGLLQAMGQFDKALPFIRDALALNQRMYEGRDHPHLAQSLSNTGRLLRSLGRTEEVMPFYRDALEMAKRLHKGRDHPLLAQSLEGMGFALHATGQSEKAAELGREALAMHQRIHRGRDHPSVANGLSNVGFFLLAMGREEQAFPYLRDALAMQSRIGERLSVSGGLSEALAKVGTFPDTRSAFLSITRPSAAGAGDVYDAVWRTKGSMARLFRIRRALARAENPEELSARLTEMAVVRRRIGGLIAKPVPEGDPQRDRELGELTDRQRAIEAEIAGLLPAEARPVELTPADLADALRPGEAFIDLYRYRNRTAPEGRQTDRYVAFVITHGAVARRIDLSEAGPIDAAVHDWMRAALDWQPNGPQSERRGFEADADRHAAMLGRLLWGPIAEQLPADTERIYISPDGDLGRVPFAALPAGAAMRSSGEGTGALDDERPGTVLLERYAIATIEGGPFLVEQRGRKHLRDGAGTLIATGGVRYDPAGSSANDPWQYLNGSVVELRQVLQLWGQRGESFTRTGHDATTDWLLGDLPKARYAHLATHGEFQRDEYAREQERLEMARRDGIAGVELMWTGTGEPGELGGPAIRAGAGVNNPLGYVGLIAAGANSPPADSPDGGILSGTSIWPLDLSGMELAVLSACETGLGVDDRTGAAGVQNLAMAFHVAGCDNIIASLWKVDDQATAALMAKFYHELWVNQKPPIEALREAQLTVMRHPGLIKSLAGERGRPDLEKDIRVGSDTPPIVRPEDWAKDLPGRLPAKYWAAFTLSGLGE